MQITNTQLGYWGFYIVTVGMAVGLIIGLIIMDEGYFIIAFWLPLIPIFVGGTMMLISMFRKEPSEEDLRNGKYV